LRYASVFVIIIIIIIIIALSVHVCDAHEAWR